jgi:hypothetical protein
MYSKLSKDRHRWHRVRGSRHIVSPFKKSYLLNLIVIPNIMGGLPASISLFFKDVEVF